MQNCNFTRLFSSRSTVARRTGTGRISRRMDGPHSNTLKSSLRITRAGYTFGNYTQRYRHMQLLLSTGPTLSKVQTLLLRTFQFRGFGPCGKLAHPASIPRTCFRETTVASPAVLGQFVQRPRQRSRQLFPAASINASVVLDNLRHIVLPRQSHDIPAEAAT